MDDTTRANGYKHGRPEGRDVKPADEIVRKVIEALPAETRLYPDVYAWQVTDALEAATSAPAVDREELRGALANVLSDVTNYPEAVRSKMLGQYTGSLIESAAVAVEQSFRAALEAATVAPAVDREALAKLLNPDAWVDERDEHRRNMARDVAGKIIDSGLLRDVRGVQAEALERVREEIRALACWADPVTGRSGFNLGNDEDGEAGARMAVLDILAQAIREARNER